MPRFLLCLVTAVLFAATGAANAASDPPVRQGPADDEIVLILQAEDWVETRTATVRIAADLAVEAGTFATARGELVTTLAGFAGDAEWRVVDFAKQRDDAGFERWSVTAEARVPEAALADLSSQAQAATRPGRALRLAGIDYTPTLAEHQAALDELRAQLYARVATEIVTLNAAFPDRTFRLRLIDFSQTPRLQPRFETMSRTAALQAADAPKPPPGLAGAEKATLTARVHLAAVAPASAGAN